MTEEIDDILNFKSICHQQTEPTTTTMLLDLEPREKLKLRKNSLESKVIYKFYCISPAPFTHMKLLIEIQLLIRI